MDTAGVRRLAGKPRIGAIGVEDRWNGQAVRGLEFRALGNAFGGVGVLRSIPFGAVAALLRHEAMVSGDPRRPSRTSLRQRSRAPVSLHEAGPRAPDRASL